MGMLITFLIGWPLALAILILNFSARGGVRRLLGVIGCATLGSLSFGYGYILAFVGSIEGSYVVTYPVAGVIAIVIGSIIGVFGTIRSLIIKHEIDAIEWEEGMTELIRGLFDIFLPQRGKW